MTEPNANASEPTATEPAPLPPTEETPADPVAASAGPEPEPGAEAAEAMAVLAARLSEAEARAEAFRDQALRALADLDNFRKRMAREREALVKIAGADLITALLPALDNLELGLKAADNHPEAAVVSQGFRMVAQQLQGILREQGLEILRPEGAEFDPHRHESVAAQASAEVPAGKVLATLRTGYRLGDRLLRPAQVIVSSGAAPAAEPGPGKGEKPAAS